MTFLRADRLTAHTHHHRAPCERGPERHPERAGRGVLQLLEEMLGLGDDGAEQAQAGSLRGWDPDQRAALHAAIEAREPFLDFVFSRTRPDGTQQVFHVSGEPIFGTGLRFLGYRGIGLEVTRPK